MIFGNNLGKRTETAKQALLAYIWDQRLEVGDRLPTQVELCRRFNVGSATVDRAVRALVKEQVLESRRGIGVFVKTSRPTGYPGRAVGLVGLIDDRLHMFNWTLAYSVQNWLQQEGCQCFSFPYNTQAYEGPGVSQFPGLESNVRRGVLQGIITLSSLQPADWADLAEAGVPTCYVGPPIAVPRGVIIDTPEFIRLALKELREQGSCRPAVLIGPTPESLHRDIQIVLTEALAQLGIQSAAADIWFDGYGIPCGRESARRCLAKPAAERPDGIVFCDDLIAQGFFAELVRLQKPHLKYLPPAVCMRNKQCDFDFATDTMVEYLVDIDRLSSLAVHMLLDLLKGNTPENQVIRYVPERVNSPTNFSGKNLTS